MFGYPDETLSLVFDTLPQMSIIISPGNLTVKSFFRFAGGRGENLSFVVDIGVGHLTPYVRGRGEFENVVLQLLESSKT